MHRYSANTATNTVGTQNNNKRYNLQISLSNGSTILVKSVPYYQYAELLAKYRKNRKSSKVFSLHWGGVEFIAAPWRNVTAINIVEV